MPKKKNDNNMWKKYTCPWPKCGWKFELLVGRGYAGGNPEGQCVSSQVHCPKCGNGLKTWD